MADEIIQENISEEEIERDQYLVFTVKTQEFGIQAMRIQEISVPLPVTEVPNAPPYVEGIANLRGYLVSVINFRKKFGFETKEKDEDTRIIMVEHSGFPIGIIVDSVEEVIKIPDDKVQKLPETTTTQMSEEYITGVGILEGRLIILLDADKVLTKAEAIKVGELTKIKDAVIAESGLQNLELKPEIPNPKSEI